MATYSELKAQLDAVSADANANQQNVNALTQLIADAVADIRGCQAVCDRALGQRGGGGAARSTPAADRGMQQDNDARDCHSGRDRRQQLSKDLHRLGAEMTTRQHPLRCALHRKSSCRRGRCMEGQSVITPLATTSAALGSPARKPCGTSPRCWHSTDRYSALVRIPTLHRS